MATTVDGQSFCVDADNYIQFLDGEYKLDGIYDKYRPHSSTQYSVLEQVAISRGRQIDPDFTYDVNNVGHRCDDFTTSHSNIHVLFAGDSLAFGEGNPYKRNWSGIMHDRITTQMSGYFCLGYLAGSNQSVINNIYNYCDTYGKPDVLFVLFPNAFRHYYEKDGLQVNMVPHYSQIYKYWRNDAGFINDAKERIGFLEQYCSENNIQFVWSSWDGRSLIEYSKLSFRNLCTYDQHQIDYFADFCEFRREKYYANSRDRFHPGTGYHAAIATILAHQYEKVYGSSAKIAFSASVPPEKMEVR